MAQRLPLRFEAFLLDSILMTYFSSLHHAEKFKKHLSSKHSKINFPLEKENDDRLSFLDNTIFHENRKISLMLIRRRPLVVFILI